MDEFNIDKFGEIIDKFLEENPVQIIITLQENSMEPEIVDNTGMGPVIQFYLLMHGMRKVLDDLFAMTSEREKLLDPDKRGEMVDAILDLIKADLCKEDDK